MIELLAPAGNEECAIASINNGANAIYLGLNNFSARSSAENFDIETLKRIIEYAHFSNVKVYVAMNTLVKNIELEDFIKTLITAWNLGVDSIIMQDIFLGRYIHKLYPKIVLHLSTQAGICTKEGAIKAKEYGFSRVILARETPILEIEKIAKIIETEVFIQGALCTCFSGQCYFSSFVGGNSGNRGKCKQPCRKKYTYNRPGFEDKCYALSLSDLSIGDKIKKLIDIGVVSFKIEGRMRRAEYVVSALNYYNGILSNVSIDREEKLLSELKRTYNRGNYTQGLTFGQDKRFLSRNIQGHLGEKVGNVKVVNGQYIVETNFTPYFGDAFKILRQGQEVGGAYLGKIVKRGFSLNSKNRLMNGDNVFITTDKKLNEKLLSTKKKVNINISLYFKEGEKAKAKYKDIISYSQDVLDTAQKSPVSEKELIDCFNKTDTLPVEIIYDNIEIEGNPFIPKSKLNAFRREFYERVLKEKTLNNNTQYEYINVEYNKNLKGNNLVAVLADDFSNVKADIAIYKPKNFQEPLGEDFLNGNFKKYIYCPAFLDSEDVERIKEIVKKYNLDGIYAENYCGLVVSKELNCGIFVGTGFNLTNSVSINELLENENIDYYALSKELNDKELIELIGDKSFILSSGNIKLMDLCYCPFSKNCKSCDKKDIYILKDENSREFKVRRYKGQNGDCRFEVYNCADLIGGNLQNSGKIIDCSVTKNKGYAVQIAEDEEKQKSFYKSYTSGHRKKSVL